MSDQDQDPSQWQLGMQLPSRKETHGRKKKGDRKLDKQPQVQQESPSTTPPVVPVHEQAVEAEPTPAPKPKRVRYVEAIPEDPKYATPLEGQGSDVPALPEQVTSEQVNPESAAAPEEQNAIQQLQAYWNESAATIALPVGGVVDASEEREPLTDEQFLREIIANPSSVDEVLSIVPEATPDEEENAPLIAKWKIALLILITPILLVIVLAWGKLAYVHRVPGFVQQEVPAYQHGQGFLILKPWWFGPPIFTLDQYERTDGEDFAHWEIQLYDYEAVVHDPTVLYTFPEDIFK